MKTPLIFKFGAIGLLILLLLIPLGLIGNSIEERQETHQEVLRDIARSSSYSQLVVGPILVVPFKKTERIWRVNEKKERYLEEKEISGERHFLPEVFRVMGELNTEPRRRGIYEARLYHADVGMSGNFFIPKDFGVVDDIDDYRFSTPYVALGISDIRGIKNSLKLTLGNQQIDFAPGSRLSLLGDGVHASFPALQQEEEHRLDFSLQLVLQGTEEFSLAPVGKETHVELHSDWPHPSFIGNFLPAERSIDSSGFNARWQTSYFSTNFAEYFNQCARQSVCDQYKQRNFGVSLIEPVNQYVKSDRAIKYALLFIGLTFASFFLFEVLKRLSVHPLQYGLVGLALAFFYLLLLSLSEHIGFGWAYLISSLACVALIGFYVSHVLQSVQRGMGFTLGLSLLYGLLYGLLSAEDYALLMGSILLFALLGTFMLLTRKVDWYAIGKANSPREPLKN